MNIEGVFSLINLLLAWSLFVVIKLLFFNENKGLDIWLVLALIGGFTLLPLSLKYATAWYSEYLTEIFSLSESRVFLISELILVITLSLGLIKTLREKRIVRILQVIFVVIYLIFFLTKTKHLGFGFTSRIIPGWHSITVDIGSFYGTLLWLLVFLLFELRSQRD